MYNEFVSKLKTWTCAILRAFLVEVLREQKTIDWADIYRYMAGIFVSLDDSAVCFRLLQGR
jgi:hypothetical protein